MPDTSSPAAARLLKGAAILFAVLGAGGLVWVGRKWTQYPELQTTQFGFEAPLWPALGGFLLVGIAAVSTLFWTTAKRVERGENLFARRHRRRSKWDDPKDGQATE